MGSRLKMAYQRFISTSILLNCYCEYPIPIWFELVRTKNVGLALVSTFYHN